MNANRVYSKEKVTFLDILEPFINVKIEEIISSSKSKQSITDTAKNTFNGVDVL